MNFNQAINIVSDWFNSKHWKIFEFQKQVWNLVLDGKSGLLNSPTGSGKTFALLFPIIIKGLTQLSAEKNKNHRSHDLKLLWITPLKALAHDLAKTMQQTCDELNLGWKVGIRTGDSSQSEKNKQQKQMPEILIITPESLHLILAQRVNRVYFENIELIVCDEWHELLGSKRGVLAQLAISQIVQYKSDCIIWGISATIDNMDEAMQALIPFSISFKTKPILIKNNQPLHLHIETLIPDVIEEFPWSGHLGIKLIPQVNQLISTSNSTLIFTNTRSQCELWYQNLLNFNSDLAGQMAMHHSGIDGSIRSWIEMAIKNGYLKAIVCTSTLDLGVDFHPVDTVVQVGSPKGIARFLQRAGRSGHRPDAQSRVYIVPTHAIELVESAAISHAIQLGFMEERIPFKNTSDLLLQFLTTLAVGEGLFPELAWFVVKNTFAFNQLSRTEFDDALLFLQFGGTVLKAYDEYQKIIFDSESLCFRIGTKRLALRHRLSIGAIVSDTTISVRFNSGGSLGTIEEYFISSLNYGDSFWFAGRCLELIQIKDNIAYVKPSQTNKGIVASWMGGRMPLSSKLSEMIQFTLDHWNKLKSSYSVLMSVEHLLTIQENWSAVPGKNQLIFEKYQSREGFHIFCYPLEGRLAHEGLASLFALRISRIKPITFSIAMNDYGFELLSDEEIPLEEALASGLLSEENFQEDVMESIIKTDIVRRKFREVSQLGGLLFTGYPGKQKKDRHIQSSSGILFEVFKKYDPQNVLLKQAEREVLQNQLEINRLIRILKDLPNKKVVITTPPKFTPFAFPIFTDRLREKLSSEKLDDQIRKMQVQLLKAVEKNRKSIN